MGDWHNVGQPIDLVLGWVKNGWRKKLVKLGLSGDDQSERCKRLDLSLCSQNGVFCGFLNNLVHIRVKMVSHGGSRITFQMFRCFHKICIFYTEEKNRTANKWPPVTDWFDFGRRGTCDLCSFPWTWKIWQFVWQIWQFLTFLYECVIAKLESSDEKVAVLQKEKVPTLLSGGVSCCCLWWHCFPCRCLLCSFPSKAMGSHPNEWRVSHCPTVWAFAAISLHMLSTRMEHTRNSFLWHLVSPN